MTSENTKTQKGDFIELEFLGKNLLNDEIFDTNIPEEAKKINLEMNAKPFIISIGKSMVVKGFDEALESKETNKKYSIKLSPEKAFGKRQSNLVKLIPLKIFTAQKIMPEPGMTLALDQNLVKVISVSGGRVLVDFNNPLAGKEIEYEFTIKRLVSDAKEKINAFQRFFFNQEFEFEFDEKSNKIIFKDAKLAQIVEAFKDKFNDFLGMDVEVTAKKEEKEISPEEKK
ncbi:MAG: FKBP-type peptidyl-prolyl cis-trans isomerase [archaeon]|nr:FKBP-type peptidyl-prolyl cis-trans isomerase [archaeon]